MNEPRLEMKSAYAPAFDGVRVTVATLFIAALFSILIVRLYVVQVLKGEEYVQKGQSNFVQERKIPHARGIILDQAGRVLVDNRPSHDVYVTASFLPDSRRMLQRVTAPIGLSRDEIAQLDAQILGAINQQVAQVRAADDIADGTCDDIDRIIRADEVRGVDVVRKPGGCALWIAPRDFPSRASVFARMRDITGLGAEEMSELVAAALKKSTGLGRFKPALLLEDISFEVYARIEAAASLGDLPGIDVVDSQRRRYREGSLASHVLGYLNEISAKELEDQDVGYALGDFVGRRGIEASHEKDLRGQDGIEPVVVDAKGRDMGKARAAQLLGPDRITKPLPGHSLVLSLDEDMQRTAEEAFGGVAGSVVALEAKTGFVLAMASFPNYDPNRITGPLSKAEVKKLDTDPLKPWTNKAIQEHYAPGSTFKAITAVAGLRNKLIDGSTTKSCPGYFKLGRSTWRCFNRAGHGGIALVKALQYSCDTYFYSLGYDLGPDRFAESAKLFGFGSRTGLDLDREATGILPDRAYYVKRFGAYTPGLVVNNAIGQGDVAVTPLQLAVAYAALANGGHVMKPQIVREVRDAEGHIVERHEPIETAQLGVAPETLDLMKEALAHVTDPGGTASGLMWRKDRYKDMSDWLRESGITLVGKTGTAQVVHLSKSVQHVEAKDVPYEQRDHAWFVAFSPYDNPEIVVVTMTEHGGFGGSTSGPVTAELMRTWFTKVRGNGRYADMPPLPPPAKKPPPAPQPVSEEAVPTTAVGPETAEEPSGPAKPVTP